VKKAANINSKMLATILPFFDLLITKMEQYKSAKAKHPLASKEMALDDLIKPIHPPMKMSRE